MSQTASLFIASDHAGFQLKEALAAHLATTQEVTNLGTHSCNSCDYPQFAQTLCQRVLESGGKGILICGTGIGMSIAANRMPGIRAALCTHEFHASAAREHNNANVLCLGARVTATALACLLADIFLATQFAGGRHQHRIDLIERFFSSPLL